ncbi:AraC-like transcriptional regulator QhpR [Vibrio viridaestus]|nr:AraC family transcriptional regulator [Vibrio viridaestus]
MDTSMVRNTNSSTVLGTVTYGLEEFIQRQGGESSVVLKRAGLKSNAFQRPNQPILLQAFCNSMHEAAKSTGNDHFGLSFGAQYEPEGLGVFGYQAITSMTLRDALHNMISSFDVFQNNSLLKLTTKDSICALEYRLLDGDIKDRRQDAEVTIGMLLNVLCRAMGDKWTPLQIQFQHPALVNNHTHRDFYHCDVTFQQRSNFIFFRESCLDTPMPDANPILNGVVGDTIDQIRGTKGVTMSTVQRVKSEIIDLLPSGEVSLEVIARNLSKSPRSLQRLLSSEQASFGMLLDQTRQELAEYYLSYEKVSLSEIAFRLGYSEQSAFTRAFMRWKSVSLRGGPEHRRYLE